MKSSVKKGLSRLCLQEELSRVRTAKDNIRVKCVSTLVCDGIVTNLESPDQ